MKQHYKAVGETDTWITPKYITEALGEFDLDPCAHTDMPWTHAKQNFTVNEDGLTQKWHGRVWLNPPFNQYQIANWMEKMSQHKNGVMLISAACETKRFHLIRHCTFTHLVEMGTDINLIQKLAGHSNVKTTNIYCHISHNLISRIQSPLSQISL